MNTMGSRHCFLRMADTADRMKTVLRFTNIPSFKEMLTRCQNSLMVCGITKCHSLGFIFAKRENSVSIRTQKR